nr:MAG TPA: antitoxin [Caudoviricetes sp.]
MRQDGNQAPRMQDALLMHGKTIKANLVVILFEDNGAKIVYCPALNVYGYGLTDQEARESFEYCLEEFFDYTVKKKTLIKELESLGWEIRSRRKFAAPVFSRLLEKNKTLRKVMDTKDFKKVSAPVRIPAIS